MMGQGELFGVLEIEDPLIPKICKILGFRAEDLVDNVELYYEIDDFVCDSVRDYIRRYWNE